MKSKAEKRQGTQEAVQSLKRFPILQIAMERVIHELSHGEPWLVIQMLEDRKNPDARADIDAAI